MLADMELCRLSLGMMCWIGNIHEARYSATVLSVFTMVRQTMVERLTRFLQYVKPRYP
jgi:hypothetical protein